MKKQNKKVTLPAQRPLCSSSHRVGKLPFIKAVDSKKLLKKQMMWMIEDCQTAQPEPSINSSS